MFWNYISYSALGFTLLINLIYWINRDKYINLEFPNDFLLNKYINFANLTIFLNIVISTIGVILKINKIINFDSYMILMYICAILIASGSLTGAVGVIYNFIKIRKDDPESLKSAPNKARMRYFAQFALFVFGIAWIIADSIFTFDWLDYITRLILFESVQYIPLEGAIYITLIYVVANFKLLDMINFKYPKRKIKN